MHFNVFTLECGDPRTTGVGGRNRSSLECSISSLLLFLVSSLLLLSLVVLSVLFRYWLTSRDNGKQCNGQTKSRSYNVPCPVGTALLLSVTLVLFISIRPLLSEDVLMTSLCVVRLLCESLLLSLHSSPCSWLCVWSCVWSEQPTPWPVCVEDGGVFCAMILSASDDETVLLDALASWPLLPPLLFPLTLLLLFLFLLPHPVPSEEFFASGSTSTPAAYRNAL